MVITITSLYDNVYTKPFKGGWGLSLWIDIDTKYQILFDVGWNADILLHNLKEAKLDLQNLKDIFLSHQHWDHLGGITGLLSKLNDSNIRVHVPLNFSKNLKEEIGRSSEVITYKGGITEIFDQIFSTGQINSNIGLLEQSLLINTSNGLVVVTGCSHPGLDVIIKRAREVNEIILCVVGGFHGFEQYDKLDDITKIYPIHCSKNKEEIVKKYSNTFSLDVGDSLIL